MIFPTVENALLTAVDLQSRLLPAMSGAASIISRAGIMLRGAAELGLDVVVTEQYPRGLGNTLPELTACLPEKTPVVEKSCFSVFGSSDYRRILEARRREVLLFMGVEMHVCLLQSVLDARNAGYEVIVVADAVGSRRNTDRDLAFSAAAAAGARLLSSESVLFMLLRVAADPHFRKISALIK